MNIKQVLFSGFGIIAAIVGVSTVVSNLTANYLEENEEWVVHTYQVKGELTGILSTLVNAETGQRGFIFTNQQSFLEPYNGAITQIDDQFNSLKELISDNPQQVERLENVKILSDDKIAQLSETIRLKRSGKEQELRALVLSEKGKQIMDEIRQKLDEMVKIEDQLLEQRTKAAKNTYIAVKSVTWGGFILVVVICGVTLIWINKIAIEPINSISNIIASSSNQIATSAEEQEQTASGQAASVNETTSTANELTQSSQQSVKQAELAVNAARKALQSAETGDIAVGKTMEQMKNVQEKVDSVANKIIALQEQTNKIDSISQVVGEIANQTNMLALNASVEAVRAGEHGKGFSVVATEIRKLADQSKTSADNINLLANQIQSSIKSTMTISQEGKTSVEMGMNIAQETTQAFVGVKDSVNNVVLSNEQISLNIKQQLMALEQVVESMNSINLGAKESVNSISQTRSSTQELNSVAQKLKAIV